uniref:hypothetical protein n=1 Tax=Thiolapillus sp. TaxID=2017437 RepID=UPI003AF51253
DYISANTDGWSCIMDIEMMNKRITPASIYDPSAADNPVFFFRKNILENKFWNDYILIGGDWNVVLDVNLDTCIITKEWLTAQGQEIT